MAVVGRRGRSVVKASALAEREWVEEAVRHRMPVEFPVTFESTAGGRREVGSVANLSPTGLFVASRTLFPAETPLRISFCLPLSAGARLLVTTARVRWVNDPSAPRSADLPAGMGIEFVGLDPRSRADLEAFLDELLAPLGIG
jgi:hypothetical protein